MQPSTSSTPFRGDRRIRPPDPPICNQRRFQARPLVGRPTVAGGPAAPWGQLRRLRARLKAMDLAIQADDVRAAAERIRPLARRTPVFTSAGFDARGGRARVLQVREPPARRGFQDSRRVQPDSVAAPEALARGIVAYSSGNHAQAVAIAAQHVGAQATIVMPEDAPRSKMEATRVAGRHASSPTTASRTAAKPSPRAILEETRRHPGAAIRPPPDHGRPGHRRAGTAGGNRPAGRPDHPGGRRRAALRLRHHRQGASTPPSAFSAPNRKAPTTPFFPCRRASG